MLTPEIMERRVGEGAQVAAVPEEAKRGRSGHLFFGQKRQSGRLAAQIVTPKDVKCGAKLGRTPKMTPIPLSPR